MISHLGTMVSTVAGSTDSQRRLGRPAVGFAILGDGSSSTGEIHETLNLASLLSLPLVFLIENNGYAYSTPVAEQFAAGTELWRRAAGYGLEGFALDCSDPETVARTLATTIAKVRATSRPVLIEAHTLRLRGHAAYDTCDYLKPGESDGIYSRATRLPRLRAQLVASAGAARVAAVEAEVNAYIETCVTISLAVPRPDPAGMEADLFAPGHPRPSTSDHPPRGEPPDNGASAEPPRPAEDPGGTAQIAGPRAGYRRLRGRLQGDGGSPGGFRPPARLQHPARRKRLHGICDRPGSSTGHRPIEFFSSPTLRRRR